MVAAQKVKLSVVHTLGSIYRMTLPRVSKLIRDCKVILITEKLLSSLHAVHSIKTLMWYFVPDLVSFCKQIVRAGGAD